MSQRKEKLKTSLYKCEQKINFFFISKISRICYICVVLQLCPLGQYVPHGHSCSSKT